MLAFFAASPEDLQVPDSSVKWGLKIAESGETENLGTQSKCQSLYTRNPGGNRYILKAP